MRSHIHDYHQLVLPLQGTINIHVGKFIGLVGIGDCVIIKSGQQHDFCANEKARFIVVDMDDLPENIINLITEKISIDTPLLSFLQFVENQLNSQVNQLLEIMVFDLFYQLLAKQILSCRVDKRIEKIISIITQDISRTYGNEQLAELAYLSVTQFKKVFKESTGLTCQRYLTKLRMEKAKALLVHTDTPISIVAEQCGYQSPSAFSRMFRSYYGDMPKVFTHS